MYSIRRFRALPGIFNIILRPVKKIYPHQENLELRKENLIFRKKKLPRTGFEPATFHSTPARSRIKQVSIGRSQVRTPSVGCNFTAKTISNTIFFSYHTTSNNNLQFHQKHLKSTNKKKNVATPLNYLP